MSDDYGEVLEARARQLAGERVAEINASLSRPMTGSELSTLETTVALGYLIGYGEGRRDERASRDEHA